MNQRHGNSVEYAMHSNPTYRQLILDVFHRHDPLQVECPTVYDGVVNDLLRYMSHRDTEQELQQYVRGVLYMHGKKSVRLPDVTKHACFYGHSNAPTTPSTSNCSLIGCGSNVSFTITV